MKKYDNLISASVVGGAVLFGLSGLVGSVFLILHARNAADHLDDDRRRLLQIILALSTVIVIPTIAVISALLGCAVVGFGIKLTQSCCLFLTKENNGNIGRNVELDLLPTGAASLSYDATNIASMNV